MYRFKAAMFFLLTTLGACSNSASLSDGGADLSAIPDAALHDAAELVDEGGHGPALSLAPNPQHVGQILFITGGPFAAALAATTVRFGDTTAPLLSDSVDPTGELVVVVPAGVDSLPQPLTVTVASASGTSLAPLTVLPSTGATLASISGFAGAGVQTQGNLAVLTTGASGSDLVVSGSGFGSDAAQVTLVLGETSDAVALPASAVSDAQLTVHVPAASMLIPTARNTMPHVVVAGVHGLPSASTLQIQ
jgi:hypothetical protein